MGDIVISRTAFCQKCADAKRPTSEGEFLLYGSDRKAYFFKKVEGIHPKSDWGYTPHVFINKGFTDPKTAFMEIHRYCGCVGCDVGMLGQVGENSFNFQADNLVKVLMTYDQWSALLKATHLGYDV